MSIVTRFPPSPTGFLHIGNARTALFNWCFARHHGGKFLLRIEDTDRKRSTDEAVQAVFDAMEWMGVDWDNKDVVYQTQNQDRHVEVALEMLEKGQAYRCFCTPEELDQMREEAKAKGEHPGYNGKWRDCGPEDYPADMPSVIRIKSPKEGSSTISDKVQGDVTVENKQLDDFILLRSDGTPTYMLAVVVDDHDMGVNHILRGDDHLNNAFRQKVIYDNMGWELPTYAHLPLLHGEDGSKFSKRHGALGVMDYAKLGYTPEALNNLLMRMGWGHGDEELFTMDQAIEWFDLGDVNKAPARFDIKKLDHMNAHYIKEYKNEDLLALLLKNNDAQDLSEDKKNALLNGMDDIKERATTLIDLWNDAQIYIQDLPFEYEEKALNNLKKDSADTTLKEIRNRLAHLNDFTPDTIENLLKDVANDLHEGKFGKVGMPLRAALTGRSNSPALPNIAAAIGKDETLNRIHAACEMAG